MRLFYRANAILWRKNGQVVTGAIGNKKPAHNAGLLLCALMRLHSKARTVGQPLGIITKNPLGAGSLFCAEVC